MSEKSIALANKPLDLTTKRVEHKNDSTAIVDTHEITRVGVIPRYMAMLARFQAISRPMAYASEFGEAFRPFAHGTFVNSMYGLSFLYVFADIGLSWYHIRDKSMETQLYTVLDQSCWHGMASLAVPAVTIHQIVHFSSHHVVPRIQKTNFIANNARLLKYSRFTPIIFGLGSIPLIIHPIDKLADFVMNNTLRKYVYGSKIEIHSHEYDPGFEVVHITEHEQNDNVNK